MKTPGFSAEHALASSQTDYAGNSVSSSPALSEIAPAMMCVEFRFCSPRWGCCDCIACEGGRGMCICSGGAAR